MKNVLLVPVQLKALFVEHPTPVREGLADYTRLPYSDGQQDFNPDVPYVSEEVLTPPFQDQNLMLLAGLHLHWYLPGALTRSLGAADAGPNAPRAKTMPAAPDRWLVTRYRREAASKSWAVDKNWLVESDLLSRDAPAGSMAPCHVPYYDGKPRGTAQPYRFVGHAQELNANWQRNAPLTGERLDYLTAVGYETQDGATGYGEPTFAAFYPHCSSVFGFYDQEIDAATADSGNLSYQVLGFYARPGHDHLTEFITDFVAQPPAVPASVGALNEQLRAAIKQEFNWDVVFDTAGLPITPAGHAFSLADVALPTQSLFSARLEVQRKHGPADVPYKVAVGNTGTEALSAFLASQLPGDPMVLEEQLEAVQLTATLSNRRLDLGAKFQEARHEKGFAALSGETLWAVVVRSTIANDPGAADEVVTKQAVPAADLHLLNTLQQQYEKAGLDLETWQRHLFADWTKYMLCAYPPHDSQDAYPDVDEARRYLERQYLTPMAQLRETRGTLLVQRNEQRHLLGATPETGTLDSLAAQLSAQLNKVIALVAAANAQPGLLKTNKQYFLKPLAGPRYWRPTDPVVLLARPGAATSGAPATGRDPRALLQCLVLEASGFNPDQLDAKGLLALQEQAAQLYRTQLLAANSWAHNPWQPFLLEWEATLFPVSAASNLANKDRSYSPDFISQHYELGELATDFRRRADSTDTAPNGAVETVYRGMSILTPTAGLKLGADLHQYLQTWMQADLPGSFYDATNVPAADRGPGYLEKNLAAFASWLPGQGLTLTALPVPDAPDLGPQLEAWWRDNFDALTAWYAARPAGTTQPPALILNLLGGQQQLQKWQCLAQSLGGFNEALLMRQQARQLEVADPLGFTEYQDLTDRVRAAGAGKSTSAPLSLNDFMPLRSGYFNLTGLRLIDNFGQVQDVAGLDKLVASQALRDPANADRVALSPRLSQAARLNLRWLSANDAGQETNTHPDTSPICGWMLPNYLDNSLAFYDGDGQPLGSLTPNPDAPWQSAPGSPVPVTIDHIDNLHLRRVAQSLYNQQLDSLRLGGSDTFLSQFIDILESGLENIAPENFAQHPDLALLIGRPVAVVRVGLDLQLQGQPAQHQGWSVFIKALQGTVPETDDFELVEFPVRLGEHRQLNDGLLGYWPETADDQLGPTFFSPVATVPATAAALPAGIKVYEEEGDPLNVSIRVQGAAQNYTLLLDPRGKLHATSGILPTKVIDIPAAQYGPALRNIAVTFLVTPLLSDRGKTTISLPGEPGFAWSWLEQTAPAQWRELGREAVITQALLEEKLPAPGIWDALTAASWLRPVAGRPGVATIVAKDQRPAAPAASLPADTLTQVEQVFDGYGQHLQPMSSTAAFTAPQVIREGWLRLSPEPTPAAI